MHPSSLQRRRLIKTLAALPALGIGVCSTTEAQPAMLWLLRTLGTFSLTHRAVHAIDHEVKRFIQNRVNSTVQNSTLVERAKANVRDFLGFKASANAVPFGHEGTLHRDEKALYQLSEITERWHSDKPQTLMLKVPPVQRIIGSMLTVHIHNLETGAHAVIAQCPLTLMPSSAPTDIPLPFAALNLRGVYYFSATMPGWEGRLTISNTTPVVMI